ncbi:DUF4190 domain-containing protein [Leucobacter allii]|uniref:DUF4190 domain-containing protein n=1 Tax=Leucobacter allii TaxID=2932247 RepID=UPI001FCFCDD3|nr:DUF4190 domain-containing protein [Leucobacter allii]UOR02327.1 DUF4190 domain-containing protein [Leucobacter allii]
MSATMTIQTPAPGPRDPDSAPATATAGTATAGTGLENAGAGGDPRIAPRDRGEAARPLAVTSFVLGIVSVVSGWTFFAPLTGLVLGIVALRRGAADHAIALWGVWLNAAMLAIWAVLAFVALAVLGAGLIALPVLAA